MSPKVMHWIEAYDHFVLKCTRPYIPYITKLVAFGFMGKRKKREISCTKVDCTYLATRCLCIKLSEKKNFVGPLKVFVLS